MRVLITGGCGFVGRHFTLAHLSDGDHVTIIDDLSSSSSMHPTDWCPKETNSLIWSLRDMREEMSLAGVDYDLVYHLAAHVGGRRVIDGDPLSTSVNLDLDATFFRWAAARKPRHIVYFSSSAAYPVYLQMHKVPVELREGMIHTSPDLDGMLIGMPDQIYGWSKLTGERLAREFVQKTGVPVAIYRPFSGYGEDQSEDYPMVAITQRALRAHRRGDRELHVWGDGRQTRDFVHIDDIVRIVRETYRTLDKPVNIGTGLGNSMRTLAGLIAYEIDSSWCPRIMGTSAEPTGVHHRVADVTRLRSLVSGHMISLGDGIRRVVAYQQRLAGVVA